MTEAEKVVALARWIKRRGIKVNLAPRAKGDPVPEVVEGFWGLTYLTRPSGETDQIFLDISGGVTFGAEDGDSWIEAQPNVAATDDVLRQLAASTALAQQAAEDALRGDMDAARAFAEKSAQAMTGQIDLTQLPPLPTPEFTSTDSENVTPAVRAEVAQAAVVAADQNISAVEHSQEDLRSAELLRVSSPDQYERAVQVANKVLLRSQQNLQRLNDLLKQYGAKPADFSEVVNGLRQLTPNPPETQNLAGGGAGTSSAAEPIDQNLTTLQRHTKSLAAKVPPPIPSQQVGLEWKTLCSEKLTEYCYLAADGLILAYDLGGTIGSKVVPGLNITVIGVKSALAGAEVADVYINKNNSLIEDGLSYLKQDKDTAKRFVNVLMKLRAGTGSIPVKDADMIPAARAIIGTSLNPYEVIIDAMLTPEAMAAMVRKASIELVSYYTNEALTKDLSERAEIFNDLMADRKISLDISNNIMNLSTEQRKILESVMKQNNEALALVYKFDVATEKIASYLGSIVLGELPPAVFGAPD